MNGRPRRARPVASWLALSLWALCVLLVALGTLFAYLSGFATGFSPYLPNLIVGTLSFSTVGALVAYSRPGNPIGWLLCATGLFEALTAFGGEYGVYALAHGSLPGGSSGSGSARGPGLPPAPWCSSRSCSSPTAACLRPAGEPWPASTFSSTA